MHGDPAEPIRPVPPIPPTIADSQRLFVGQGGAWRTIDLSTGEVFAFRGQAGLTFSHQSGPGALLSLRPTPEGIYATPATPDAKINGQPLQRPRLLGKFDLLELAGAMLRSDDGEGSEEPSQPVGWSTMRSAPEAPQELLDSTDGSFAGRYALREKLGEGGFGAVYKAWDSKLQRAVAIKVLVRAEGRALQRFAMEIRATAALRHPNLVTVFDSGIVDAHPYLVMELIEGQTLDEFASAGTSPSQLASIFCDVTRALAYAHQQGLLHRDIKPQNILVRTDGNPVLLDFGLVRVIGGEEHSRITRSGTRLGTLPYMSPEQAFASELDERSEVYGLGASLYHALAGQYPFTEAGDDILVAIVNQEPAPPSRLRPGVPSDLEAICLKCMEKRPRHRYPTAAALAMDLQRFLDGEPTIARPLGPGRRLLRRLRRDRQVQILMAGTVAMLAVLGSWAVAHRAQQATLRKAREQLADEDADRERRRAEEVAKAERDRAALAAVALAKESKAAEQRLLLEGIVDRPQGVDKELAVFELVKAGKDPTVTVLTEWLDALASDLLSIEGDELRKTNELRIGEHPIEFLEKAILARIERPPLTPLTKQEQLALKAAKRRIRHRAKNDEQTLRVPSFRAVVSDRQMQAIPAGRFVAAEIACRALGRLEAEEAVPALGRYLHAELDPLRACAPGMALGRLESAEVFDHLLATYNRLGVDSIFGRRLASALKAHLKAGRQSPTTVEGYLRRSQFYRSIGDVEASLADADKAVELDPSFDEAYMLRSVARVNLGDLEGARADLDRAIELLPLASELWSNRSNLRLMQGDKKGALADAVQAVQLNSTNHLAYFNLGQAASALDQLPTALTAFSKALSLDPSYAAAWAERAVLRTNAGDLNGAWRDVERALALDPKDAGAWSTSRQIHFSRGDLPAALEAGSRAIDLEPRRSRHYYHRALCYSRLGNHKQALADAEAAVRRSTPAELPTSIAGRARCFIALGMTDKALADLDWSLQKEPNMINGRKMRASIDSRFGPPDRAIPDLEFLTKATPRDPQAWAMLADVHYRGERFELGDVALRRAEALSPGGASVLGALGVRHVKRREYDKALVVYDKLTLLSPQQPYVWNQRAAVHVRLGNYAAAVPDYEQFLELAPNSPESEDARQILAALRRKLAKKKVP